MEIFSSSGHESRSQDHEEINRPHHLAGGEKKNKKKKEKRRDERHGIQVLIIGVLEKKI